MKIGLISCCKEKRNYNCKAEDMYISPLFIKSLKYAESLNLDRIYILSAKYGLVEKDKILEPYNVTLKTFSKEQRENWYKEVMKSLDEKTSLENDEFIILAGSIYYEGILNKIHYYSLPLGNLSIGRRLQWLDEQNKSEMSLF